MQAELGALAVANLESTGSTMEANVEAYRAARVVSLCGLLRPKRLVMCVLFYFFTCLKMASSCYLTDSFQKYFFSHEVF